MILQQQTATVSFYVPVVAAWTAAFLGLEVARRLRRSVWPAADTAKSWWPRLDLGVALLAVCQRRRDYTVATSPSTRLRNGAPSAHRVV